MMSANQIIKELSKKKIIFLKLFLSIQMIGQNLKNLKISKTSKQ